MKRRCSLCTVILTHPAPPWTPPGAWGMCANCAESHPHAAAGALARFLAAQATGEPYIVRSRMSRSYSVDARPADYSRAHSLETR